MEDGDPIPDMPDDLILPDQVQSDQVIENHQKDQQRFYIVYQIRIRKDLIPPCSLSHKTNDFQQKDFCP